MIEHNFQQYFPFAQIRSGQEEALKFSLETLINSDKKFVVLELPTGIGKSATAITLARYFNESGVQVFGKHGERLNRAYVLTTQKILQQQYVDDFGGINGYVSSIKSASNYMCTHHEGQTCAESRRMLTVLKDQLQGTEAYEHCMKQCHYVQAKRHFLTAPIGVTNFSYFLAETMYAKQLQPRAILIIDEAHNTEAELSKFIEITFSEKFSKDVLGLKMPAEDFKSQDEAFEWVKIKYKRALTKQIKKANKAMSSVYGKDASVMLTLAQQHEKLDKHICKINRFIENYEENPSNWILNQVRDNPPAGSRRRPSRHIDFKTIDVSSYSHESLFDFGGKVVLMSATIVDHEVFCRSVGIPKDQVEFLKVASPFHFSNRPIHFTPVGSMSKNCIDKTLPKMAEMIGFMLDQHKTEKGIIHATSYKIAQFIKSFLKSDRLLMHESHDREQVYLQHLSSTGPTVLLSPSMTEGVDLADDSSRFQIICKVPYPYLGDEVVKRRMQRDSRWYDFQTAKTVIQALGRSIRNENDYAISYILDSDWRRFFERSKNMFPKELIAAVQE